MFLVGLNIDASGFEKRVPDASKLDSVQVEGHNISGFLTYMNEPFIIKGADNIASITSFHKDIVANKKRFLNDETSYKLNLELEYRKGKSKPNRNYTLDYNFFLNSPDMKVLYESKEYKDHISPLELNEDGFSSITLYFLGNKGYSEISVNQAAQELLKAYEKDLRAMTFEEIMTAKRQDATLAVSYYKKRIVRGKEEEFHNTMEYLITSNCSNTIKWMKDNGYWDGHLLTAKDIESVTIYKTPIDPASWDNYSSEKNSNNFVIEVRDKEKIQKLIDNADRFIIDDTSGYYGNVRLSYPQNPDSSYNNASYNDYEKRMYDEHARAQVTDENYGKYEVVD
ncbi:MAG: hypothetical protein EOM67_16925, partial [Spirochaetia bacterium]|nr:hypothetical protein [Spirochaetia bacterium]